MYLEIPQGSKTNIQGLDCHIPPEGYVWNMVTKKLEPRGVHKRSDIISEQFWERMPLPTWYKSKVKEEDAYEKRRKEDDPPYYDEVYEKYKQQEWDRRLNGFWFMNNGVPTYLTGSHYVFLQWWQIDIGYPKFRIPDMEYFYFLQYCIEDPDSMGMLEITKRRFGKTFRGGLFLYEYPTRTKMTNGGIQSKTGNDAKKVFAKAVINPFKKLPRFFRPEYDMSLGITPKSEIRFQQTNVRGKKAEDGLDKEELGSMIDFQSADTVAYDGQKLHRYFSDEWAKCFSKGTKIRMYDGSIKNVENITNGELVMGDDSTPRKTYGITSGTERMYRVIPNSGEPFECNESHILSLKKSGNTNPINISLREYFTLSSSEKKNLMLWKVGVEYKEAIHFIEPYFLGAWLGDGTSKCSGFTSNDKEVIDYMQKTSTDNKLLLRKKSKYDYHISSGTPGLNNVLLTELKRLSLIDNKHIPKEYLIDSVKNRLQLLAGLIDTDGHLYVKNGLSARYEITQKRKELAYQIQDLARSCGFKATLYKRITTMARKDGTIYKCDVFKVCIYGELYKIPCKVERKQAKIINIAGRRKNPLRSGFKIEPIGEGEYYGFAVGDNHLFLLSDYTVVHNTTEVNIYDRHDVIRYCMLDDEGRIIGKALYSSTVEVLESEKDGVQEAAINLWNDSDQNNRGEDGRTPSGLYRFFMTADRARNFDIYGFPDVEKTIKAILADRETVKHNQRSWAARVRKEARTIKEAFYAGNDKCEYNAENLANQIQELEDNPVFWRQCRLVLKKKTVPSIVIGKKPKELIEVGMMDDAKGGWFILEAPINPNKFDNRGGFLEPKNAMLYQIGVDTTQDRIAVSGSNPAIVVFKKSLMVDGEETGNYPVAIWISPTRLDIHFDEEVKKACLWYGCKANYEIDRRTDFYRYFCKEECQSFLTWTPPTLINPLKKRTFRPEYGSRSGDPFQLAQMLQISKLYIDGDSDEVYNGHVHRIKHIGLLQQGLEYNHLDRTKSDLWVALQMALVAVFGETQVATTAPTPMRILKQYKIKMPA
jgi:homing endonuclease-like protein/LAGLIDADG DNA endonuclease family protein